jgi:hypothetical protein
MPARPHIHTFGQQLLEADVSELLARRIVAAVRVDAGGFAEPGEQARVG